LALGSCKGGRQSPAGPQAEVQALVAAGRTREAAAALKVALDKGPDPRGFLWLGTLDESLNDWEQSRQAYRRASEDKRTALYAHHGLARLAWKEEDPTAARRELEQVAKAHGNPIMQAL